MIAGHDLQSQCRPALGGAGIGDDLRPENRQYLKCAKEHADETLSLTQLDPAEHTCLIYFVRAPLRTCEKTQPKTSLHAKGHLRSS